MTQFRRCSFDELAASSRRAHERFGDTNAVAQLPGAFYFPHFVSAEHEHDNELASCASSATSASSSSSSSTPTTAAAAAAAATTTSAPVASEHATMLRTCVALCERRGSRRGFISGLDGPRVCPLKPPFDAAPSCAAVATLAARACARCLLESTPVQVSVNYYARGARDRMVPHKDGSGTRSLVVSLGAPATMYFYAKASHGRVPEHTQVFVFDDEIDSVNDTVDDNDQRTPTDTTAAPSTSSLTATPTLPSTPTLSTPAPMPTSRGVDERLSAITVSRTPTLTLRLEPGSALLMTGDAFLEYAHAVPTNAIDGERRVSVVLWSN